VLESGEAKLVEEVGDIRSTAPTADAKAGLRGEVGAELDRRRCCRGLRPRQCRRNVSWRVDARELWPRPMR
jgi:hypothetical protein